MRTFITSAGVAMALLLAASSASGQVLLVGTYNGIPGRYASIQAAVDKAKPGDWILVGPGDYHERADYRRKPGPQPTDQPAGVVVTTPNLHIRGMDRNAVVVDGTKPGSPQCSASTPDQDFGVAGPDGTPLGRNGILIWKANNTWVENLTVCNFLGGSGSAGNELWWNGGDGGGQINLGGYWANYVNATSTYFNGNSTAAAYGIFSSDATNGSFNYSYASNMNDSNFYVGACQQQCDVTLDHVWSQNSTLGYSGTNSGGTVVVKNSEFDHNKDGFDTNSQNNDDWPSPQDGACPGGGTSPITGTQSCWVFMNNMVHDNNNPNVPGAGVAAAGPVGTGMTISGGRDDSVMMNNTFANNGAWGVLFLPYPDTETPPPNAPNCQGGITSNPSNTCLYDDWGNALLGNTFSNNGFFGNPTNGDFGEITETAAPTNCYHGNIDTSGEVTSSPGNLQAQKPVCNGQTVPPDPNPQLTNQVACDSQFFASLLPTGSEPCTPGSNYPRQTKVEMAPLPTSQLATMPNPCLDVPKNPWCP